MYKCMNCGKEVVGKGKGKGTNKRTQQTDKTTNGQEQTDSVSPECKPQDVNLPANYGQPDCECKHCQQNRRQKQPLIISHGDYKPSSQLAKNEDRVSLSGDVDYEGVCLQVKYNDRWIKTPLHLPNAQG